MDASIFRIKPSRRFEILRHRRFFGIFERWQQLVHKHVGWEREYRQVGSLRITDNGCCGQSVLPSYPAGERKGMAAWKNAVAK